MIYSDNQYRVAVKELSKLKAALNDALARTTDQDWLRQAEVNALTSQVTEVEGEIAEYDQLRNGEITFSKRYALEELPRVLVQARIAGGLTQTDLATRLGMKPQQIQRYEATSYMGASLARLIEISRLLGVQVSGSFQGPSKVGGSVFVWNDADDIVWGQLPYKEMIRRGWFEVARNANPLEKVKEYFLTAAGPQFATAFHRKKVHAANAPNEYALIAWQARVLERARLAERRSAPNEFALDDRWLGDLSKLTVESDGPLQATRLLAEHGIVLVVERHLPGSYLDGAAMLGEGDRPIVGLTLRHDRLDNFWFVLFHELGHAFLHLPTRIGYDFFDEEGAADSDTLETEADNFALNWLIPQNLWDQCLSRFALSEEAVLIDADNLGIAPSIIAGRIRRETNNYTILSDLVGQGEVRRQFREGLNDTD